MGREWPAELSEEKEDRDLPIGFGQMDVTLITLVHALSGREKAEAANAGSHFNNLNRYRAVLKFIL